MAIQAYALYGTVSVAGAGQTISELGRVSGAVGLAQRALMGLGPNALKIGTGVGQLAQGMVKIGEKIALVGVAVGAESTKMAGSFQAQMTLIRTQAGNTTDDIGKLSQQVLALVDKVGQTPDALARGLYHIESVGVRGAAALDILKAAALGADVGLADMESTSNALTAVWFSGIKGAKSMTDAMAILDGIVGVGNMRLNDLTQSFKSGILGTSATFGIDIRSLGAAIATLTDAGIPADIAATRLNMTLNHMAAPTAIALKQFKKLGMGQFDLANDLRRPDGIFQALKDLRAHLQKAGDIGPDGTLNVKGAAVMSKIFGGGRFGATAMQLINVMGRIQTKYDLINSRAAQFGANVDTTFQTAGFQWHRFISVLEEGAVRFGSGILPTLTSGLKSITDAIESHMGDITAFGREVGAAIGGIDWKQVEAGASSFAAILRGALDILSKIPVQIDVMVVGFLGLNKLSGGLLGKGVGNIVGGLAGIITNLMRGGGSGGGGIGSVLNRAFVQHVWVDNMGAGMGGLPGVAGAAGGLGLLGSLVVGGMLLVSIAGITQQVIDAIGFRQQRQDLQASGGLTSIQALALQIQQRGGLDSMDVRSRSGALQQFIDAGTTYDQVLQDIAENTKHYGNTANDREIAQNTAETATQTRLARQSFEAGFVGLPGMLHRIYQRFGDTQSSWLSKQLANIRIVGTIGTMSSGRLLARTHDAKTAVTIADIQSQRFIEYLNAGLPYFTSGKNQVAFLSSIASAQAYFKDHGDTKTASLLSRDLKLVQNAIHAQKLKVTIAQQVYQTNHVRVDSEWLGGPGTGTASATAVASTDPRFFGHVIGLAGGGISDREQFARISEGNKREAIIPLESEAGRRALGGLGEVRVDVRPQRVSLSINNRELAHAVVMSRAFVRGS